MNRGRRAPSSAFRCCKQIVRMMGLTELGRRPDSVVVMLPVALWTKIYETAKRGSRLPLVR